MESDVHVGEAAELYALGALDEREQAGLEAHIAHCAQCLRRVGEAEETLLALERGSKAVDVPRRQGNVLPIARPARLSRGGSRRRSRPPSFSDGWSRVPLCNPASQRSRCSTATFHTRSSAAVRRPRSSTRAIARGTTSSFREAGGSTSMGFVECNPRGWERRQREVRRANSSSAGSRASNESNSATEPRSLKARRFARPTKAFCYGGQLARCHALNFSHISGVQRSPVPGGGIVPLLTVR